MSFKFELLRKHFWNVTVMYCTFLIPRAPVIVSEREREQTEWTQTDLGIAWD